MVAGHNVLCCKVAQHPNRVGLLAQICMGGAKEASFRKLFQYSFLKAADAIDTAVQPLVIQDPLSFLYLRITD